MNKPVMDRMKTAVAVTSTIMLVRHGSERGFVSMVAAVVDIELENTLVGSLDRVV
jgi:hypothetical protein